MVDGVQLSGVGVQLVPPSSGSGTVTDVVAGNGLGGGPITSSGTLESISQGTIAGGGTITIVPVSGVSSVLINGGSSDTTIDINQGFVDQRLLVNFKQGATAHGVTLGPDIVGTLVAGFVVTPTASARDLLQLICLDGTHWALAAVSQNYSV